MTQLQRTAPGGVEVENLHEGVDHRQVELQLLRLGRRFVAHLRWEEVPAGGEQPEQLTGRT